MALSACVQKIMEHADGIIKLLTWNGHVLKEYWRMGQVQH